MLILEFWAVSIFQVLLFWGGIIENLLDFGQFLQPLLVSLGQIFAHLGIRHLGFVPVVLVLSGQIVKVASIIVAPPVLMASLGAGKKASWRITDLPEVIFLLCQRGNL